MNTIKSAFLATLEKQNNKNPITAQVAALAIRAQRLPFPLADLKLLSSQARLLNTLARQLPSTSELMEAERQFRILRGVKLP